MITIVFSHGVKDFTEWKKVYDANAEHRAKAGVNVTGLYQSVDDPNMVTIIGNVPSVEDFNNFNSDPELISEMQKAGVTGIPEVKILNKVE
ncbi:MAG: DUF3764 family protein [Ignavibacteriae bacterium]|nr:DUF3764 family protein [Ignavibacteriota bacterium]